MAVVSVVIPTFNRSHSIVESVESVLRQTYADLELIVVDDCSTDNTVELLSQISDPRLQVVVHARNVGAGAARNTGMRIAAGEFVAFQDSDDEWLPTKLAKQLALLRARDRDWIAAYCGMLVVREIDFREDARTRVRYIPGEAQTPVDGDVAEQLLEDSFISTQTLVLRRDVLPNIGEFDETLPALEDWDFMMRIARAGKIAFVDEPLVLQRFSTDSITRSEHRRIEAHVKILEKIICYGVASSKLRARHYFRVAGGYRIMGDHARAMQYIRRALAADPVQARYWLSGAYVASLRAAKECSAWFSSNR